MTEIVRIAMWSGPRNISTAMMRAFGNRPDTVVRDEPFYAAFLELSGIDHPMREEVIAAGEPDWRRVIEGLFEPLPGGATVCYQKQMTHHMLPQIGRDWIDGMTNAFLIRRPESVLASYVERREAVTLDDIGFLQQGALFDLVAERTGRAPPVVDAADILDNPERVLRALCAGVGIDFTERMLNWPPGYRDSDGIWAAHWYDAVAASTGFKPPSAGTRSLPPHLRRIADQAQPTYERLRAFRLAAD